MLEQHSIQSESQSHLKKLLPIGTCLPSDHKKYEYIRTLIASPFAHHYILPIGCVYTPLVVVKLPSDSGYPTYNLHHHPSRTFLLSAQQQNMSIGCNYLISRNKSPQKDQDYVGKLRGNFHRDAFFVFDNGENPDRVKVRPRRQLAFIERVEKKGVSMIVPRPRESSSQTKGIHNFEPLEFECRSSCSNPLLEDYNAADSHTEYLHSREEKSAQSRGKSSMVTLESSLKSESIVARKRSQTYYELYVGCPLSLLQGFAFLLALIESQLL